MDDPSGHSVEFGWCGDLALSSPPTLRLHDRAHFMARLWPAGILPSLVALTGDAVLGSSAHEGSHVRRAGDACMNDVRVCLRELIRRCGRRPTWGKAPPIARRVASCHSLLVRCMSGPFPGLSPQRPFRSPAENELARTAELTAHELARRGWKMPRWTLGERLGLTPPNGGTSSPRWRMRLERNRCASLPLGCLASGR